MKKTTKKFALLALLLGVSSVANAASVSYNTTYGPEAIPQSSHIVGTLPLFNPALGTLISVSLTLNAETSAGSIDWENVADVPSSITLGIGATVNVQGEFGGLAATAVPMQLGSGNVTAYDGTTDFMGTSAFSVSGNTGADSDTDGPIFNASYIGVGSFNVTGDSALSTLVSTSGGFGPTQFNLGNTTGEVIVTYVYEPVPEPSTVVLLGLGMASVVAVRRLRKRA